MAVPVLQAQGAIANVTGVGSNLVITLPAYQADDIVVLTSVGWVPNTTTGTNTMSLASPWTKYSPNITTITGGLIDGEWAFFWARAANASSLGTTVTITRPTSWDTGNDTAWGGRAYVIRGCATTGNPYDQLTATSLVATANQAFPAITVTGVERLPVVFYCSSDNNTAPTAASGWTVNTAVTDAGGTDVGFQSYDIEAGVSTSTSAVTPTGGGAPAQGSNMYFAASFRPPSPRYFIIT